MVRKWIIPAGTVVVVAGLAAFAALYSAPHLAPSVTQSGGIFSFSPLRQVEDPAINAQARARIAPHKALYKIEMVQKRSSSQVLNIYGDMYFEWRQGCSAWMTDHRFNLYYEYPDSPPMRISSDFTTYEPFSGKSFDFNTRRRRDGELYEELRGHAIGQERGGEAVFSLPDDLHYDLPEGTLFPVRHTMDVLQAMHDGRNIVHATIFDGSDTEGPVEVNAVIGKAAESNMTAMDQAVIDTALLAGPARYVRLAFFPLSSVEPDSDYEMRIVLHENGIISDMFVEYKDFSVTQTLVGLEKLEGERCDTPDKNR